MEYKTCIKCSEHKELKKFSEKRNVCNSCRNASKGDYRKRWREANPEKVSSSSKAYYERNKNNPESAAKLWLAANKEQVVDYRADWHQKNKERRAAAAKIRDEENKEHNAKVSLAWRTKNKDKIALVAQLWRRANKAKVTASTIRHNARKIKATPAWANPEKILSFYTSSNALGMLTGEWYHVDHIVPLQSDFVCGLHCEDNLQVLPALDNQSKGNRWWPDMW